MCCAVNDEATGDERISYSASLSLSARRYQMNATAMTTERPTQYVSVRTQTARLDDAARVAGLAGQLGYLVTPGDTRSRLHVCLGDRIIWYWSPKATTRRSLAGFIPQSAGR
jgi:hypothetical protein